MNRLVIPLTQEQEFFLVNFFLTTPDILHLEHYLHTHSPLDDLGHYMWEESQESDHPQLAASVRQNGKLSLNDITIWIRQEINEANQNRDFITSVL